MAELILNAEVRNATGKENSKKLRAKGMVPTVVYGKDVAPIHCAVPRAQVDRLRKVNRNSLISLQIANGGNHTVIVRDTQKHPINHTYEHVDLQAVHMDKPVKVDVDLEFIGTPIGKKSGGIFTTMCKQVKIECLPGKIPEVIQLNIDNLEAGDSLHVSDIQAGDFKIVTSSKIALCQVSQVKDDTESAAPGAAAAATAAPAAAPAAKKAK